MGKLLEAAKMYKTSAEAANHFENHFLVAKNCIFTIIYFKINYYKGSWRPHKALAEVACGLQTVGSPPLD